MDGSETSVAYQNENPSTTTTSAMNTVENQRPMYTVPGILHFLQHEWTRFEIERQQWETERAELQARIAFLQGERQGQENLKTALVRRIKMLEYALKQERLKFTKLKYGSETAPSDDQKSSSNDGPPIFDDDETKDDSKLAFGSSSVSFKQGRQLLRQYLKEIGYVDTIIDLRSTTVKKLLGIKQETNLNGSLTFNGDIESKRVIPNSTNNTDFDKSLASLVAFKDDQIDDESNDDDIDTNRILIKSNHDLDNEEAALQEFDFLSGESSSSMNTDSTNNEWNIDSTRIDRLKEEYKRDRQTKPIHRNCLLNNGNSSNDEQIYSMMFENNQNFIGNNTIEGLDELARETVSNDNELQDDITTTTTTTGGEGESNDFRKIWSVKYVLRSHLDGVRCVAFHPVDSLVITGSEDRTLKLWNLDTSAMLRKSTTTTQDLEPIYTFRRHTGPVLSLTMNPSGEQFYSGGLDSLITVWNLPNSDVDPYGAYDSNVIDKVLMGHTDAVWQLVISGQNLLSCSADGTVRLWHPNQTEPLRSIYTNEGNIPISIDWLMQDTNQFVVTYDTLKTVVFDTETGKILREFINDSNIDGNYRINRLISHPSQPIVITGHEDRKIRFFDSHSGRMIYSMNAHLETVTCLAMDSQQTCLVSGSHDRSIRLWNFESKTCHQELTVHQKKDDEAIHDVIFHSSKPYLASVGADSIAKIYA